MQNAAADTAAPPEGVALSTDAGSSDPTDLTRDVLGRNPRFKKPALAILELVGRDREPQHGPAPDRASIEREAAKSWPASIRETPAVVVDMLVRNRALVDQVTVDGRPYAGTLEDVQLDETVPEDADVRETLAITEDGRRLLEDHDPRNTLYALFQSHPHYADVYRAVLWACDGRSGCMREELEEQIKAMPQLLPDATTGQTRVYPQYFIDALQSAGGIEWDGAWRTTDAGRAAMDA